MCDYSLQHVRSRPAEVDDRLVTKDFGMGTRGFACQLDQGMAVCLLPGTEIAFKRPIRVRKYDPLLPRLMRWLVPTSATYNTAIFRQINRDCARTHHDALEFPDGKVVLLTSLAEGQRAVVLQLPAPPRTREEAAEQERGRGSGVSSPALGIGSVSRADVIAPTTGHSEGGRNAP